MRLIDLSDFKREPIENHTSKGNQPKWRIKDMMETLGYNDLIYGWDMNHYLNLLFLNC